MIVDGPFAAKKVVLVTCAGRASTYGACRMGCGCEWAREFGAACALSGQSSMWSTRKHGG